ncbi:MAG: PD-(D/E)XK nuclease family protein [Nanoarchaeota archaeon]|nr:PD-(D/E)XK nuclease family protein [Nanoarchaeota archaeon]
MQQLRDKRISFDEETHTYFVDSKKISKSVTEFINDFFKEFDSKLVIEKWYGYWQSNENSKYYGMAKEEISGYWKKTGEESRDRGTLLHKAIEDYELEGKIVDTTEFKQYLNFKNEFSNLKIIISEYRVFDEELSIAGTIDCIMQDSDSKEFYIFDWKRVKEIKETSQDNALYPLEHLANTNYWKYALQLNMYKYILEKHYGVIISGLYLVQFHEEKEDFNVVKVVNMEYEITKILKYIEV